MHLKQNNKVTQGEGHLKH